MDIKDIKEIMIVHNDSDFSIVWDWIGHIVINTLNFSVLNTSHDIEKFILKLIPIALEFIMYSNKDIDNTEVIRLTKYLSNNRFKYNFPPDDSDWEFGGSETVIIDLVNKTSYIR